MPLLARMLAAPLSVDIGPGAVAGLGPLLADRRISSGGDVAVVVGSGQGERIASEVRPQLGSAVLHTVSEGTLSTAMELAQQLRSGSHDALVGIGGGRTLDIAKYAASISGLPMVAVATSLAHDGLASPVASLEEAGQKRSYGVQMPVAVVVDLDYVRESSVRMRRSGIGDVVSNLSAIADWELAQGQRGEALDGLAAAFARVAAEAVLGEPGTVEDDSFLSTLADALVISGLAMSAAGSSRPCSGGEHEIVHAIDRLFPDTANHGELAGVATLFTCYLREDEALLGQIVDCLGRHELPRLPAEIGLEPSQFAQAVVEAPATRPDRYTVIEHIGLDAAAAQARVEEFDARLRRLAHG